MSEEWPFTSLEIKGHKLFPHHITKYDNVIGYMFTDGQIVVGYSLTKYERRVSISTRESGAFIEENLLKELQQLIFGDAKHVKTEYSIHATQLVQYDP